MLPHCLGKNTTCFLILCQKVFWCFDCWELWYQKNFGCLLYHRKFENRTPGLSSSVVDLLSKSPRTWRWGHFFGNRCWTVVVRFFVGGSMPQVHMGSHVIYDITWYNHWLDIKSKAWGCFFSVFLFRGRTCMIRFWAFLVGGFNPSEKY